MVKRAHKYKVTWGEGLTQKCYTKKEALGIMSDLLVTYKKVTIERL